MKSTWRCPKCNSDRVGYLEEVLGDGGTHAHGTRKVGKVQTGSLLGMAVLQAQGDFEAFVCTACGYFEEYVRNPEAIAWDRVKGFRWCRPAG